MNPDDGPIGPIPRDLLYVALLFTLLVVPRILQRFRLPGAVTSIGLGVLAGPVLGLFERDSTVDVLSTFGIVALFLFAGLDVNVRELRREGRILGEHLIVRIVLIAGVTFAAERALEIDVRAAGILALALLTPSTGFILDALASFGLPPRVEFWVRGKAIAAEIVALGALFVLLQSTSVPLLAGSAVVLGAMVVLLPVAFRAFAALVVPHAPRTEFSFLIMVAVVCAVVTRELGVYYLVGAFAVGMAAQRFRERLPALGSERMLHAVEAFASVFVPFYFFHAGLRLRLEDFGAPSLLAGGAFVVTVIPLRIAAVAVHRHLKLGESFRESLRVAVPLVPTLVFTLVLAEILRERFEVPQWLAGSLVVYAIVNTLLPGLVFRVPPPEYENLELPPAVAPKAES